MKELLEAIAEEMEMTNEERDYELDLYELVREFGY